MNSGPGDINTHPYQIEGFLEATRPKGSAELAEGSVMEKHIPTLDAYHDKSGELRVWCEYCQLWHIHSAGDGHRVAHCLVENSAYTETGYALKCCGEWTAEMKQRKRRRLVRCGGCGVWLSPVVEPVVVCPRCGWEKQARRKHDMEIS